MKINVTLVRQLRIQKSWSQEELAIISGLNLRTIQRIEKDAAASLQSKKALASAFDIDVHELDYEVYNMVHELVGKKVTIWIGSVSWTEGLDGEVLEVNELWLKLKSKKRIEYIRLDAITKISL